MRTDKRWLRWLQRTLVVVVLAGGGLLAGSCGGSSGTPCDQICDKIYGCNFAVTDNTGKQLTVDECKSSCKQNKYESLAGCVTGVSGCDQAKINACFTGG
jgi:hypothetical protein